VDRRYLPLLLASNRFAPSTEQEPLDRLRLQKGVFLLEMRGPEGWRGRYEYLPWDWGPFSRDLAVEVNDLVRHGLIEEKPVQRRRHPRYRTTTAGEEKLDHLVSALANHEKEYVRKVRAYVTSRSFSQLLREVYNTYPEYAVASRFQG
jgi:uncharacterized protein YwgA